MSRFSAEVNANLLMLFWRIWSERNSVLRAIVVEGSIGFLARYMDSLVQYCHNSLQPSSKGKQCALVGSRRLSVDARKAQQKWIPPPLGMMKINR